MQTHHSQTHRTKIQNGGRIVIPAKFREAMDLAEGTEVVLRLDEHGLYVSTPKLALQRLRALVKKHPFRGSIVDELIADRRKEAADE